MPFGNVGGMPVPGSGGFPAVSSSGTSALDGVTHGSSQPGNAVVGNCMPYGVPSAASGGFECHNPVVGGVPVLPDVSIPPLL